MSKKNQRKVELMVIAEIMKSREKQSIPEEVFAKRIINEITKLCTKEQKSKKFW